MNKFLNFYSRYPWVAVIIVLQWLATAFVLIYGENVDIIKVMGVASLSTILFAYFGFKLPKS